MGNDQQNHGDAYGPRCHPFGAQPLRVFGQAGIDYRKCALRGRHGLGLGYAAMSIFQSIGEAIGRRVARKAVGDYFASDQFKQTLNTGVDSAIRKVLAGPEYAWFRFVKLIQAELQRVDPTIPNKDAFYMARNAFNEHLRGEKIAFGDERYCWDAGGAQEIAHAYEIDHWEARP